MSFDYFNNSMLAFGAKLTRAFRTLEKLQLEAEANVEQVIEDQEIFNAFVNRNYQVPRPTKDEAPCRTDEIFDILNDKDIYLRRIEYVDGKIKVEASIFNRANNRITKLSGSSSKKEAYVYYKSSISNQKPNGTLEFSTEEHLTDYQYLFHYRIDSNGNIMLIGDVSKLNLLPWDMSQYHSMSKGDILARNSAKYTAKDYEAVCIVGESNQIIVNLNGNWIFGNKEKMGYGSFRHCILYLKPDDVITGTYNKIFRINYNK